MDLAWTTLVVLVLLLPAVLFFVGLSARERAPREVIRASAIGEIGLALLVAILIHFSAIGLLTWFTGFQLYFFVLPLVSPNLPIEAWLNYAIAATTQAGIYMVVTGAIGLALGFIVSYFLKKGRFRFLATHKWAYDLLGGYGEGLITAHVMTNIVHEHRVLMYQGRLREFYLSADGRVSYLVLTDCSRFYMYLDSDIPKTGAQMELFNPESSKSERRIWNYLAIDGAHIANVLFEKTPELATPLGSEEELNELLRQIEALAQGARAAQS